MTLVHLIPIVSSRRRTPHIHADKKDTDHISLFAGRRSIVGILPISSLSSSPEDVRHTHTYRQERYRSHFSLGGDAFLLCGLLAVSSVPSSAAKEGKQTDHITLSTATPVHCVGSWSLWSPRKKYAIHLNTNKKDTDHISLLAATLDYCVRPWSSRSFRVLLRGKTDISHSALRCNRGLVLSPSSFAEELGHPHIHTDREDTDRSPLFSATRSIVCALSHLISFVFFRIGTPHIYLLIRKLQITFLSFRQRRSTPWAFGHLILSSFPESVRHAKT